MKKYIFLLIPLTAIVIIPVVYQRWSEASRLEMIKQTKQKAAEIDAIPFADFLKDLDQTSPEQTLMVLYTGNTQAHLEPCGCFVGQSGGLPRRATAISQIAAKGFSPLTIDLGSVLPSEVPKMAQSAFEEIAASTDRVSALDSLRAGTTLTAMGVMGYQAMVPGSTEANVGVDFVKEALGDQSFPLLAANLEASELRFQPYLMKTMGGKKIALVGLSALENLPLPSWNVEAPFSALDRVLPEIRDESDFVIVLSNLAPETNRDIAAKYPHISAILSHESGETEQVGDVLLAYSEAKGKTLGVLTLWVEGDAQRASAEQIALTEAVPDDPEVRAMLDDFYEQVATDPRLQKQGDPLFSGEPLEGDAGNGYVGSEACKTCHLEESDQWMHSSHAAAFNTLLAVGRQFYPECVSCHVTGFGYETGYRINTPERNHLAEVGCETCHGPGKQHVNTPLAENIRGEVPERICASCHNAEHSPGFEQLVAQLMPEVDHSRKQPNLKTLLEQRMRGSMKPQVELFVMSYCPYGVTAEEELLPFFRKYGDTIDFKLRFIANKADDADGELAFTSLHGAAEVFEDLRQMVIAERYPDKFFDYLLCRASHLQGAWVKCARELGLDVDKITREIETERVRQRFLEDVRRTEELNIFGSPTLVIDGRIISGNIWRGKVSGVCQ